MPRYQFRPMLFNQEITIIILLKAITNLPHSDFTLCKCIFDLPKVTQFICLSKFNCYISMYNHMFLNVLKAAQYDDTFIKITQLWEMLETCQFDLFWVGCHWLILQYSSFNSNWWPFWVQIIGSHVLYV